MEGWGYHRGAERQRFVYRCAMVSGTARNRIHCSPITPILLMSPQPPTHQDAEGFQSIFPSSLLPRTDSDHSCGCDLIERSERIPGPLGPPPSSPASPHSLGSMIDLRTGELCAGQTLSPSPGVWDSCGQADSREGLAVLQKQRQHFPGGQKKKTSWRESPFFGSA